MLQVGPCYPRIPAGCWSHGNLDLSSQCNFWPREKGTQNWSRMLDFPHKLLPHSGGSVLWHWCVGLTWQMHFNFPISLNLFGYLLFLLIRDVLAFPIHLVSANFDHVFFNQPQLLDALQAPGGKTVNPQSLLSGPMSIDSAQSNFTFLQIVLPLLLYNSPPPPAIPQISICIS